MCRLKEIAMMPREEIMNLKSALNLNEDESIAFDMAIKDKSAEQISRAINVSVRSVFRILSRINTKIDNYIVYQEKCYRFEHNFVDLVR